MVKLSVKHEQTICFFTTSSTVLLVRLFYFLKSARCRTFGGWKFNFTPKTDLLILTHYLLSPVGYFPIIETDNLVQKIAHYTTMFD